MQKLLTKLQSQRNKGKGRKRRTTKDKTTRKELFETPAGILGIIMVLSSPTVVPDVNEWAGLILILAILSFIFLFIYFSIRIRHYEEEAIYESIKHISILTFTSLSFIAFFGSLYGYGYIISSPNPILEFVQTPLLIALIVSIILSSSIDMLTKD